MNPIVPVTAADIPELVAISRETFAATFDSNTAPADMTKFLDDAYNPERLLAELNTPGTTFWFIKVDQAVAGYLKVNIDGAVSPDADPASLELERIYIRAAFKRHGLGSQLFAKAEAIARDHHKPSIMLGVWEGNTAAQAFYRRLGFHKVSQHVFQVGTDPQTDWLLSRPVVTADIRPTADLTPAELLTVMAERVKVFVVEQHCAYQEVDAADQTALHVMLRQGDQLVAYARIIPHHDGNAMSFGRVLVVAHQRGQGLAHQLVSLTLKTLRARYPDATIKIQAQAQLTDFYGEFGFVAVSDSYLEDGIPHVDMVWQRHK